MSSMLDRAFEEVRRELALTEEVILASSATGIAVADAPAQSLAAGGGKRIRPAIFLLSARVLGSGAEDGRELAKIAAAIEMIHAASLMHDDVVDASKRRRGRESVRSALGDKLCVLAGDFMWTSASGLIFSAKVTGLAEAVNDSVRAMTLGQMLELSLNSDPSADAATCLRVIEGKTASLFALAARAGAIINRAHGAARDALAAFGLHTGMAFQIMDDAMDYVAAEKALGKMPGADLSAGTPTLPFVLAMQNASEAEAAILRRSIRGDDDFSLHDVLPIIERTGGVARALELSSDYARRAKEQLSVFPDTAARRSLMAIAEFASSPLPM